jgi:DNA polymerase-3 subunit beta
MRPPGGVHFQASLPAGLLSQMLRMALSVAPNGGSSAGRTGALLEIASGIATLVATDGHRLACLETTQPAARILGDHRSVVPWGTITGVAQTLRHAALGAVVEIARFGSDLHFRVGDQHLYGGPVVDGFPNYEPLLQEERSYSALIDRRKLENAIGRVLAPLRISEAGIRIRLEPGRLRLTASNGSPVILATAYQGLEVETTLNSRYLIEALGVMDGPEITFRLSDSRGPVEIGPVQTADGTIRRCIIMPLRI